MPSLSKSLLKTARTLYLYGDAHAVLIHERRDPMAGPLR